MIHRSRPVLTVAAVAGLLTLAACGGGEDKSGDKADSGKVDSGKVATLETGAPQGQAPAPAGTASAANPKDPGGERGVRHRLDETDEERQRIIGAWHACLIENGAPEQRGGVVGPGGAGEQKYKVAGDPVPKAAREACLDKRLLPSPEEDPKLNPHYTDARRDWVTCINDRGAAINLKMKTVGQPGSDDEGLTYVDGKNGTDEVKASKIVDECRIEAFGKKR